MSNQSKFRHIEEFCPKYGDKKSNIVSWNQPALEPENTYLDPYLTERYPFVSHIIGSCKIITIENDQ